MARRALPGHARVRGDVAAGRGARAAGATGCMRCSSRRRRSTSGTSGRPRRASRSGATSPVADSARRVCREFRLGLSPGTGLAARRRRRASPSPSSGRQASTNAARQRLLPAAPDVPARRRARPGRRLPGAQAPRRRPVAGEVRELPRGRALPQVGDPLRPSPRAAGDREERPRDRGRGKHRRDRAAAGRARAGRRVDGHSAHRAAPAGALAPRPDSSTCASTRTPPARPRRSAGWSSRWRRASTCASCRYRRGRTPPTRPTGFEARLERAEPYALYRVRIEIQNAPPTGRRPTASARDARRVPDSPERQDAWRYANDKLGMTVQIRAAGSGTAMAGAAVSPRLLEAGERLERDALAGSLAHPEVLPLLAEMTPEHFDAEPNRLHARGARGRRRATRRARAAARRAQRPRRRRGDRRERPRRSCCCGCGSGTSGARSPPSEPERTRELQDKLGAGPGGRAEHRLTGAPCKSSVILLLLGISG